MKNKQVQYFIIFLIVVAAGIISRKIPIIPLCIGDALYAVMVYCMFRIFLKNRKPPQVALFSLAFCFLIECTQLYQANWIMEIRKTYLGHQLLGQGFLWSDLIAYFFGTLIVVFLDIKSKTTLLKTKILF